MTVLTQGHQTKARDYQQRTWKNLTSARWKKWDDQKLESGLKKATRYSEKNLEQFRDENLPECSKYWEDF